MQKEGPQFENLSEQLSHPSGEEGLQVGEMMHRSNSGMIQSTIDALELSDRMRVLELGHANCGFLPYLLKRAKDIRYTGLEISATMFNYCNQHFSGLVESGTVSFNLYNGLVFPFEEASFDRAFNVNTIYFWKEPLTTARELLRVLKPGGKLAIGFAHRSFMGSLPFVNELFRLYDPEDVTELLQKAGFTIEAVHSKKEEIEGKHGEIVHRAYSVVVAKK